jgi:uncharacterized phage protein gp47/JayE
MFAEETPQQVDYTSRDYESIRTDLIARIQEAVPEWTGEDPSDFGLVLVEQFAYLGDLLSYYADRAANESSLSTATRRDSVIALARDLGYSPSGYRSSTVELTVTNTSDEALEIPAGTIVSGDLLDGDNLLTVAFQTDADLVLSAEDVGTVAATQGTDAEGAFGFGEALGTSDGTPNQKFVIADDRLVLESLEVYVYDMVNYVPWTRVFQFADYGSQARVFQALIAGNGTLEIQFGDGVSGLTPSFGHSISAKYRRTDGSLGNVPAGAVTRIDTIPGLLDSEVAVLSGVLSVTNDQAATGGTDQETTESIRRNASMTYRAANRAVTLEDYQNISLTVGNCGKASAESLTPGAVVVFVAPQRSPGAAELRPGYTLIDNEWVETDEQVQLKAEVQERLDEASLAGVQASVVSPVYVDVYLAVDVTVNESVRQSDAEILIRQTLLSLMDYSRVSLGARVYASDVVAAISGIGTVTEDVTVTRLNVDSALSNDVKTIVAAEDEILIFSDESIEVNLTGGVA